MNRQGRLLFRHKIRGHQYIIREKPAHVKDRYGDCDPPDCPHKSIRIKLGNAPIALVTQIHEVLHACSWDMSEEAIDDMAVSVGSFLWKLGWRNVSVPKAEGGQL
jgi:hypothetical protein